MRVTAAAIIIIILVALPAAGGFAMEYTQIWNHSQLVLSYLRQAQELKTAIDNYTEAIRNGQPLTMQMFHPIKTDLVNLAQVVRKGQALAYSLSNLDGLFYARYPGYGKYQPHRYYTDYRKWSQTTLDTAQGVLAAVGMQTSQLNSEQTILSALQAMSQTADGRMQALEVGNELSELTVQQLMKLRQLMLADMTAKHAYQAFETQQKINNTEAAQWFFNYVPESPNTKGYSAGWK